MIAQVQNDTVDRFRKLRNDYQRRTSNSGYRSAETTRFSRKMSRTSSAGSSGDQHLQSEHRYHLIAERAEDIDRNDIVASQGLDRLCCNILQSGFQYEPETGDAEADKILKDEWLSYANSEQRCDLMGDLDFDTLSWVALRSVLTRGDLVSLPLIDERIQLVENYRVRTPSIGASTRDQRRRIVFGVEMDSNRRSEAIWMTEDDIAINELVSFNQARRFPVYDDMGNKQVFLHKLPRRQTLTRGISAYSPVMEYLGIHDDIQFAKMIQQQMVSVFALIRKRPMGFRDDDNDVYYDARQEADPCRSGNMRPIKDIAPGMWYTTLPGEDVSALSGNVPNPTFFDHAKQVQQLIALNLGLPLILFLLDASETNFSGWRGALDQAKLGFQRFQSWWSKTWHRNHLLLKLRAWSDSPIERPAIARLRGRIGDAIFRHSWILPVWPYVQPLTDVQADVLEWRTNLNSPRRIQRKHSRDWDVVCEETVQDMAKLIRRAKQEEAAINSEFPDSVPVSWREIVNLAPPEGVQINMAPGNETQNQDQV